MANLLVIAGGSSTWVIKYNSRNQTKPPCPKRYELNMRRLPWFPYQGVMSPNPISDGSSLVILYLRTFAPETAQDSEPMKPIFDFDLNPISGLIGEILRSISNSNSDPVYIPFSPTCGIFPNCGLHSLLSSLVLFPNSLIEFPWLVLFSFSHPQLDQFSREVGFVSCPFAHFAAAAVHASGQSSRQHVPTEEAMIAGGPG